MRILHLSLKKLPFDVMVTGEKDKEYRKPGKWIQDRMLLKWPDCKYRRRRHYTSTRQHYFNQKHLTNMEGKIKKVIKARVIEPSLRCTAGKIEYYLRVEIWGEEVSIPVSKRMYDNTYNTSTVTITVQLD